MTGEQKGRVSAAARFRAQARSDAGLFTRWVNYPVAAQWCVFAYRMRLRPTTLTLANLLLGSAGSVLVIAAAPTIAAGQAPGVAAAVLAWLMWQAAYCCDCADGQLARVTATSTPAGARLDVLCDIGVQIMLVTATAVAAAAGRPGLPVWLPVAFAGTWMVNLVTSVMARQGSNTSLLVSAGWPVQAVKLTRDYGFVLTVIAGTLAAAPDQLMWLMAGFTLINGGFLVASIIQSTRAAWSGSRRATPTAGCDGDTGRGRGAAW
ncbi:CDP-alcohol phosphatidyltransferase family protein [Actinoplanes flavus]|uniref:CDP-alcohol phosphatidyltransferase family protein n=1 Tax=Actinoplanes flavus TaxID=2820290 RepID=A0ABS3UGA0_9ACTN|nr:CDP-alcohol phosphatidyltransferase family protein [Actinoplanes flavus]MBO3736712.1 CDP-alcohol phosphatidyltransferase family protein [Actinoplanes flavus]